MDGCHQHSNVLSLHEVDCVSQRSPRDVDEAFEGAVRVELTRIMRSAIFVHSDRLSRFLRFAVEAALAKNTDTLKEYVIGVEVYDRKPSYNPTEDSIVRSEARRLRIKLKIYYETEGKNDPVFIYFRPGTYVPVFRAAERTTDRLSIDTKHQEHLSADLRIAIAILPFVDVSATSISNACAKDFTTELIHAFANVGGFRVAVESASCRSQSKPITFSTPARNLEAEIAIDGTMRVQGDWLRVTAQCINADGWYIWSQRFEAQIDAQAPFPVFESIASALVNRVQSSRIAIRRQQACSYPFELVARADI